MRVLIAVKLRHYDTDTDTDTDNAIANEEKRREERDTVHTSDLGGTATLGVYDTDGERSALKAGEIWSATYARQTHAHTSVER